MQFLKVYNGFRKEMKRNIKQIYKEGFSGLLGPKGVDGTPHAVNCEFICERIRMESYVNELNHMHELEIKECGSPQLMMICSR